MNKGEGREKDCKTKWEDNKKGETGANEMGSELQGRDQWRGQRSSARREEKGRSE